MSKISNTLVTLTVQLSADHIDGLAIAAGFGADSFRSGHTDKVPDFNPEDGHNVYEAGRSDEATAILEAAFNAATAPTRTQNDRATLWNVRLINCSDSSTAFFSHSQGWTDEANANRFTTDEITNSNLVDVLASAGIETCILRSKEVAIKGTGWTIYSAIEAANRDGLAYWSSTGEWVDQSRASVYAFGLVKHNDLAESLGADCQWHNLRLANITDEEGLNEALTVFCKLNGLPLQCASELLFNESRAKRPLGSRIAWLEQFNRQWEALMDTADKPKPHLSGIAQALLLGDREGRADLPHKA
ncbi:hypothetical protein [Marinobacter sp. ELB17]|uniref:hypothetical protein n=1 Tax=Marinobacter sp. ELB17 TaxID=270374 RepID=UPI0012F492F4|nr:hypothetical protein [Marinobacter sp. ELB17]